MVPVLFTFYIQGVQKLKKNYNSGAKSLSNCLHLYSVNYEIKKFGSCIIHILYTGCAKIKKIIIPAPKG